MMKCWSRVIVLLLVVGFAAAPAFADMRLKASGFIDNHVNGFWNASTTEEAGAGGGDLTLDKDDDFLGRTRGRLFLNIAANEFSEAVFGFEFDQIYGDTGGSTNGAGSGFAEGFDLGNDNNVFELKWLYVDVKIPNTPISFQLGGLPVDITRLKRCVVFCDDGGGIVIEGAWSPQVKTYTWFIVAEEELIENGPDTVGEDYTVGTSVRLTPFKGLDVDLVYAFYGLEAPSSDSSSLLVGSCSTSREGISAGPHCFARDDRHYFGLDLRWRLGNLTISPTFIYLAGERKLRGGGSADLEAFLLDARAEYVIGPLTVEGRFVYIPGNKASDDLGDGSDLHYWQNISVTTVHRSVQWFEILGWNIDSTRPQSPFGGANSRSMQASATFDQFGLVHGALKADYQLSKPLSVSGAVGFFATDEKTGAPARMGANVPRTYNFTGNDSYLGTEIDFVLTYEWFKGTTVQFWFAHAFIGDGQDLCTEGTGDAFGNACDKQNAEDVTGVGARMLYRF